MFSTQNEGQQSQVEICLSPYTRNYIVHVETCTSAEKLFLNVLSTIRNDILSPSSVLMTLKVLIRYIFAIANNRGIVDSIRITNDYYLDTFFEKAIDLKIAPLLRPFGDFLYEICSLVVAIFDLTYRHISEFVYDKQKRNCIGESKRFSKSMKVFYNSFNKSLNSLYVDTIVRGAVDPGYQDKSQPSYFSAR